MSKDSWLLVPENAIFESHYKDQFYPAWCSLFEGTPPSLKTLIRFYRDDNRFYHNTTHINFMMNNHINLSPDFNENIKNLVTVSIFMHDLYYDAKRNDNERTSALLFSDFVGEDSDTKNEIIQAILDTVHLQEFKLEIRFPEDKKEEYTRNKWVLYFLDLDLLGFASDYETVLNNTRAIRKEFSHLSDSEFLEGRRKFLSKLLNSKIYYNPYNLITFSNAETIARENIKNELYLIEQMIKGI